MTLQEFYTKQNIILNNGLFVLLVWAIANLCLGFWGIFKMKYEQKSFFIMNFCWNIVNLMIVICSFYMFHPKNNITKYEVLENQHFLETIFLVNVVLDVLYIMFGFYLQEKAKNTKTLLSYEQNIGFGWGLFLQGGFLFCFDFYMFWVIFQHKNLYNFGL